MLNIIKLEDRETPSVLSHDGRVRLPNGTEYVPFSDFSASHYTSGKGDTIAVGAAYGGGPRVQVVKMQDYPNPPIVEADFFAFESSFRGGVRVSTDGVNVATTPSLGGGPVVAVFDASTGKEISRFFAFDPSFRGGADVQLVNGIIYVSAGPGGGPVVAMFDIHGNPLGAFYGAPSSLRTGFDVLAIPDAVGGPNVDLVTPSGDIYVNVMDGMVPKGQYKTALPKGFNQAGYAGAAISFSNGQYVTGDGIDLGFNELAPLFAFDDHAAGNSSPPPTTGFREGVYFPAVSLFSGNNNGHVSDAVATVTVLSGESVGSVGTGTGTLFAPMVGPDGTVYAVTASHVTNLDNYELIAPGPLDGPKTVDYGYPTIWTNFRYGTYSVDASAVPTKQPLTSAVYFNGVYYQIDGLAVPKVGQPIIAVGRGFQPGIGVYSGLQTSSVHVDNGYANGADLEGQYVVGPSIYGPLAIPGFSGGPAFTLTVDSSGIHRWLVGMVVAGDGQTTYVTPVSKIEDALGLKVKI